MTPLAARISSVSSSIQLAVCILVAEPVHGRTSEQVYTADFEGASPLDSLVFVDYAGSNNASSPAIVGGRSGGSGVQVGGGVEAGNTFTGTSSDTQYPGVFLKFPVTADLSRSFTFSADVNILDEGTLSDLGIFVGRLSAFNADPAFYHFNFVVFDSSNAVYYHADHGNDNRGDRPNGPAGETGRSGTPTPVTGNLPSGLLVDTWYRFEITWDPAQNRLAVTFADGAVAKGNFSLVLDGSISNPNAPTQKLNAPLPSLVEFAVGTFNDGVIVDNVSIAYNVIPTDMADGSTIVPGQSYLYAANAGWLDSRPTAITGLVTTDSFFQGWAYAANFGWVDFGAGLPQNGFQYGNSATSDFGVNLRLDGALEGYAYGANIGWINFEQTHGKPRLDFLTGRLSGHAYSTNLGWIELGSSFGPLLTSGLFRPDGDGDSISDSWEWQNFDNLTTASGSPPTNADMDRDSDLKEFQAGTDPNDPADYVRILSQSFGANFLSGQVVFTSSPARLYRIEHQAGLGDPWTDSSLGLFRPATGSQTTSNLPLPGGPRRFLRVAADQPLPLTP